ncbi:PACE efflux transporter [Pseudomonas silvicola]|nr:PACE efflux transporter [Pseudomonas silvicola]
MQGISRRVLQALLYEGIAVLCVGPLLNLFFHQGMGYSTALAVIISVVALGWNLLFNLVFEHWERHQRHPARTPSRRVLHAAGFEGGLVVLLVPLMAAWLGIGLWQALAADLGLFGFFFLYALVFQWGFDRVFGGPQWS